MPLNFSDNDIEAIIKAVFAGKITPFDLPEDYYIAASKYLGKAVTEGFGASLSELVMGAPDYEMLASLKENIYVFSAAKTFQQTLEMSESLVDNAGELRNFKSFRDAARQIYTKYNGGIAENGIVEGWIRTEYSTAISQSMNAAKWLVIEEQREGLPYLRYVAVNDRLACTICQPLNNICLPIDHPFWKRYYPANHFNCRCIVEQLDMLDGKQFHSDRSDVAYAQKYSEIQPEFMYNVGQRQEVYATTGSERHPYFSIPKQYREAAKENFNMPINVR